LTGLLEEVSAGSRGGGVLEEVSAESGAGGLAEEVSAEFGAGCVARGTFCDRCLGALWDLLVGIEAADVSIATVSVVLSVFTAQAAGVNSNASAKRFDFNIGVATARIPRENCFRR
jgi:hypothetical protein